RFFAAATRVRNYPANCQGAAPLLVYFNRNLIRGSANAPRFHFHRGLHVVDGALEDFERLFAGLVANLAHRIVKNTLCYRLLSFPHHAADELGHERAVIDRIRKHFASFGYSSSWHKSLSRSVIWHSLSAASRRTSNVPAYDRQRRLNRVCRESRDSEHQAG